MMLTNGINLLKSISFVEDSLSSFPPGRKGAFVNNVSPLLLSDVGCGASLARAALECAAMNVLVNTRSLPDDAEAAHDQAEALRLRDEYGRRAEAVAASVEERLVKP